MRFARLVSLCLCAALATLASAQDRIVFATDWLAAGGARRLLPGDRRRAPTAKHGLDVTIKMGGPQVNGLQLLAAGQLDVAMADAPAGAVGRRARRAAHRDRRDVPEESDGHHRPSGRARSSKTSRASRSPSAPPATPRSGRGSSSDTASPTSRSARTASAVQPFLADPDLSQQGFVTSEPFSIEKAGVTPVVFLLADLGYPPYSEVLVVTQRQARAPPRRAAALRARVGRGLEELSRQSRAGQCADQARQPADERRRCSPTASQDEANTPSSPAATPRRTGLLTMTDARWHADRRLPAQRPGSPRRAPTTPRPGRFDLVRDVKVLP